MPATRCQLDASGVAWDGHGAARTTDPFARRPPASEEKNTGAAIAVLGRGAAGSGGRGAPQPAGRGSASRRGSSQRPRKPNARSTPAARKKYSITRFGRTESRSGTWLKSHQGSGTDETPLTWRWVPRDSTANVTAAAEAARTRGALRWRTTTNPRKRRSGTPMYPFHSLRLPVKGTAPASAGGGLISSARVGTTKFSRSVTKFATYPARSGRRFPAERAGPKNWKYTG